VDEAQRRLSDQIDHATQRLLGTARVITEPDLRAPSLLPGWTRAHVLGHLARGADAMRYLLVSVRTVARQLSDAGWQEPVRILDSAPFPAAELLTRRLVEVELHHCDLGAGYTPADWPPAFAAMELAEPMRSQRADRLNSTRTAEPLAPVRPPAPYRPNQRLPGSWLGTR